jgi:hypothetical protein
MSEMLWNEVVILGTAVAGRSFSGKKREEDGEGGIGDTDYGGVEGDDEDGEHEGNGEDYEAESVDIVFFSAGERLGRFFCCVVGMRVCFHQVGLGFGV